MLDLFYKFDDLIKEDSIFWFCALSGSGLFIIQLALNFFGAGSHTHMDDQTSEFDTGKFKWLSKQALTGFLMMFGWVGLTCRREFELSGLSSAFVALGGGIIAICITGLIFRGAKTLLSSGTVFKIEDVIGKEAIIYQRIPRGGAGKISVSLHNFTYEVDAISHHQEDLQSFTSVQIIKKSDEKTVLVVPIK